MLDAGQHDNAIAATKTDSLAWQRVIPTPLMVADVLNVAVVQSL
jgi:hypothetical protein